MSSPSNNNKTTSALPSPLSNEQSPPSPAPPATTVNSIVAFKNICNFVNELGSHYGKKHKPLKLYRRILNETQISHDLAIEKNINIFRTFCVANREALQTLDKSKLVEKRIVYSEKVYIDMNLILNLAKPEHVQVIWQHLLTIGAIVDPESKAIEILKTLKTTSNSKEANFLSNIINKVEGKLGKNPNPGETIGSIMQSGLFTELLSDMNQGLTSGEINVTNLFGTVQTMMSSLQEQVGDDPDAKQAFSMINNMTSMLGTMTNAPGQPISQPGQLPAQLNPADMLPMMMSMMGGIGARPVGQPTESKVVPKK